MKEEYREYDIFVVKNKEGQDIEMAVVDEFEYEQASYAVCALVKEDTISEEELYIYKVMQTQEEETSLEKIEDPQEYQRIAAYYLEMQSDRT